MPEIEHYAAAWRERIAAAEAERREREARAHSMLPELTRVLVGEFRVRKVVLFGTLAGLRTFRRESDIDLAVSGIDETRYEEARARLCRVAGDIPVDLVPWEWCGQSLKEWIAIEGRVLHDADPS